MDMTPKLHKRCSLSLNRIKNRRQTNSPQNRLQTNTAKTLTSAFQTEEPGSPLVHSSLYSESNIHTPPSRKLNLDDSLDYSPQCFDTSFSPSNMLSQTLAIDSPEVGWRWTNSALIATTTTPDSAYADSSYTSAGSSTETSAPVRTRSDTQRRNYELRREEQLKNLETKIRRAEKLRADELLKKRCAKLQAQLQATETHLPVGKSTTITTKVSDALPRQHSAPTLMGNNDRMQLRSSATTVSATMTKPIIAACTAPTDALDAFFNDSDMDDFLVEVTQQVETQIAELTQKPETPKREPISHTLPATKHSDRKQKNSSFYMKFLEDDSPDDWFESLDEAVREAESKKPRTSFQRYNSMPSGSNVDLLNPQTTNATTTKSSTVTATATSRGSAMFAGGTNVSASKIKRHASSHTLSPAGSNSFAGHLKRCRHLVRQMLEQQQREHGKKSRLDLGFRREPHAYTDDYETRATSPTEVFIIDDD